MNLSRGSPGYTGEAGHRKHVSILMTLPQHLKNDHESKEAIKKNGVAQAVLTLEKPEAVQGPADRPGFSNPNKRVKLKPLTQSRALTEHSSLS